MTNSRTYLDRWRSRSYQPQPVKLKPQPVKRSREASSHAQAPTCGIGAELAVRHR